jgi:hypothetical protein
LVHGIRDAPRNALIERAASPMTKVVHHQTCNMSSLLNRCLLAADPALYPLDRVQMS